MGHSNSVTCLMPPVQWCLSTALKISSCNRRRLSLSINWPLLSAYNISLIYCWINLLPRLWKSQERHKDYRWTAHRGKSKHAASFTGYIYLVNDDPMIFLQLLKIVLTSTFFTLTYFHHFPFLKLPTVIFTPLSLAPIAAALAGGSLSPHTWFSKWNFPLLPDLNY